MFDDVLNKFDQLSLPCVCPAGSGSLFAWDIADLAPQQHWKALNWDDYYSYKDNKDTYIGGFSP
jgi:hypothetical protein